MATIYKHSIGYSQGMVKLNDFTVKTVYTCILFADKHEYPTCYILQCWE